MEAHNHRDYDLERDRLKNTQKAIDEYAQGPFFSKKVGADEWANDSLKAYNISIRREYLRRRPSPYFSRVDFQQDGSELESIYFGYRGLNLGKYQVIEWRAPVGRLMASTAERQTIKVPEGFISGNLILRRRFKVDEGTLMTITDEIDRRAGSDLVETVSGEEVLIEEISSRGDPLLKDIVRTIQKQQDDIIRSPHNRILVINGVAGSGKTSIAIHRLAYLLFPDNETNIRASASIVFCPNQVFLGYISDLLPNLGEKNVTQTTFSSWALQRMIFAGLNNETKIVDDIQNKFLDPHTDSAELARLRKSAQAKGRIEFKRVLENYLDRKLVNIKPPKKGWIYKNLGELKITLSIPKDRITNILTDLRGKKLVFETMREETLSALQHVLEESYDEFAWAVINDLRSKSESKKQLADLQNNPSDQQRFLNISASIRNKANRFQNLAFANKQSRRMIIQQGIDSLKEDFNKWWPPTKIVDEYYQLLSDKKTLACVANGILTEADIEALAQTSNSNNTIGFEDIAALYCFYRLVYSEYRGSYDHIVIDEAQDFSPVQLDILRQCSKTGSMIIVGDIAQGIHSYRGISSWEELTDVFKSEEIQFENITQSYRSSKEIVAFSNAILQKIFKDNAILARPLGRVGGAPVIKREDNREKLKVVLTTEIATLQKMYKHIAVLVKNNSECMEIGQFLHDQNIVSVYPDQDVTTSFVYSGGLVVLPVALSKGIEFEAVIIFNANNVEYSISKEYDGHLLYVGVTRALHHLSILFAGVPSEYLDTDSNLALNEANTRAAK